MNAKKRVSLIFLANEIHIQKRFIVGATSYYSVNTSINNRRKKSVFFFARKKALCCIIELVALLSL